MDAIINQFKDIPTTCISDAMEGLNNLHPSIKPLKQKYKFAGRALPVKIPVGDNLSVLKAIRAAKPGDVIVVDSKGNEYRGIAGDFVVGMAQTLGVGALVVDGTIQDCVGIKDLDLPVFCRGTTCAASGKAGIGEINVPISSGSADGVVVIPQQSEKEILSIAMDRLKRDQEREANISGKPVAIRKYLDRFLSNSSN